LFQRRRSTAKLFPMLHDTLPALDSLGPAGMSSDESDVDVGGRVYYICTPLWRNDSLRPWLSAFDTLYIHYRNKPSQEILVGSGPSQVRQI
ncbi:hypothetical protein DENSPDRAFT_788143, partial [Dentipellis sp. KUC8613]